MVLQEPFSRTGTLPAETQAQPHPVRLTRGEDRVRAELFPMVIGDLPCGWRCCYVPGTRTGARRQAWAERTLALGLDLNRGEGITSGAAGPGLGAHEVSPPLYARPPRGSGGLEHEGVA